MNSGSHAEFGDRSHGRVLHPSHLGRHYCGTHSGWCVGDLHGTSLCDRYQRQQPDFARSSLAEAGTGVPGSISAKHEADPRCCRGTYAGANRRGHTRTGRGSVEQARSFPRRPRRRRRRVLSAEPPPVPAYRPGRTNHRPTCLRRADHRRLGEGPEPERARPGTFVWPRGVEVGQAFP